MAGKSLPGFSQLPVITELFFLCGGIKSLLLLERKMRDFRVFLGSWAERVFCWSRQRRWRGLDRGDGNISAFGLKAFVYLW